MAFEDEFIAELRAQILGDIRHLGEIGDTVMVNPAPQLARPHPGFLLLDTRPDQGLAQTLPAQSCEIGLCGQVWGRRGRFAAEVEFHGHLPGSYLNPANHAIPDAARAKPGVLHPVSGVWPVGSDRHPGTSRYLQRDRALSIASFEPLSEK